MNFRCHLANVQFVLKQKSERDTSSTFGKFKSLPPPKGKEWNYSRCNKPFFFFLKPQEVTQQIKFT